VDQPDRFPAPPAGALSRLLRAVGNELEHCGDDEEQIDALLGAAFVTCQAYIAAALATAREAAEPETEPSRGELLRRGTLLVGRTGYTRVELIDALADYYKHRDGWDPDWAAIERADHRAAEIVASLGAQPRSPDILLRGARALGVDDFRLLDSLATELADWSTTLISELRVPLEEPAKEPA
jgi:hypothetical protein